MIMLIIISKTFIVLALFPNNYTKAYSCYNFQQYTGKEIIKQPSENKYTRKKSISSAQQFYVPGSKV